DYLAENADALPHLFNPNQVTIIAVTDTADGNFKIVLFVVEVRMFAPKIVLHTAAAQIWSRERIGDGARFRNDANVTGPIDKDLVAGQQAIDFIQLRNEPVEKGFQLWDESRRQVADLSADARIGSGKSRAGQQFKQVIEFLPFGEGVEEHSHGPEVECHC